MQWLDLDTSNCSIQRTLDLIGDRWSLLVLREAFNGVRRFDDLSGHLGVSDSVLSRRLQALVDAGILARTPYRAEGSRTRNEYRLTERGLDLFPIIIGLLQWGDRYVADDAGSSWSVIHEECGTPVKAVVRCVSGHDEVRPMDTTTMPGPSARTVSSLAD